MKEKNRSRLRFNFGFLIEGDLGESREIELDYPRIRVSDDVVLKPLQGKFQVSRTSKGLYLQGVLTSHIETECTRCLNAVDLPISIELDDLFYYPPAEAPEGEYIVGEDGMLDLAPLVRELSLLEIPMQVFCREECLGLCPECGKNLNDGPCDCQIDDIDPRLAALRALLDDDQLSS